MSARAHARAWRRIAGLPVVVLLLLLLLLLFPLVACSPDAGDDGEAPASDPAPDFTLERLQGGEVSLASLQGKTVVIDFWATWCPPCEFQVPVLNAFWKAHGDRGDVAVLGISVDTEGPDVVGAWADEKGVEYPILLGDDGLARRFGALGFPTLVVVSPDGQIALRHIGLIELEDLEAAVLDPPTHS